VRIFASPLQHPSFALPGATLPLANFVLAAIFTDIPVAASFGLGQCPRLVVRPVHNNFNILQILLTHSAGR